MTEEYLKEKYLSLLKLAKQKNEILEEDYEELLFYPIKTLEEQETAYNKFEISILSKKIIKGAEYIEEIGKDHKNYEKAIKRYDELVKQLQEIN
jgi:hypothetical protein